MLPTQLRDDSETNPIAAIRQHPLVVLFFAVLFAVLGAAFAISQPAAFSARAVIVVEDARAATNFNAQSSDAERYVADQVAILESRVVAEAAAEITADLDPPLDITVDDFLSNTTVASTAESNVITIGFVANSAVKAQAGADAVARSYEQANEAALAEAAQRATGELDQAIAAVTEEIDEVQGQIEALRTDDDDRVSLEAQLDDLRRESATVLGVDAASLTPEERLLVTDVAERIQLVNEELQSRLLVAEIDAQDPAKALLLRQRDDSVALLSELTLRRSQIEVDARLAGNGVEFAASAGTGRPRGIATTSAVVLMGAVGALIGAGVAYWLAQRRRRVGNRLAPQSVLGAPLLADMPRSSGRSRGRSAAAEDSSMLAVVDDPKSSRSEAFRVIVGVLMKRLETEQRPDRGSDAAARNPDTQ